MFAWNHLEIKTNTHRSGPMKYSKHETATEPVRGLKYLYKAKHVAVLISSL